MPQALGSSGFWPAPASSTAQGSTEKTQKPRPYLDLLFGSGHDALSHKQAVIFKKLDIFLSVFFTLVNEEFY